MVPQSKCSGSHSPCALGSPVRLTWQGEARQSICSLRLAPTRSMDRIVPNPPLRAWAWDQLSKEHGFTTHFHKGHISGKPLSLTEPCPNWCAHVHRHTCSIGMVYFLSHEGMNSSRMSGWETSFPVLPSAMYKSVPSIFGEFSGKKPRAELEEPSGEARINTQEQHKLHNPERQIYISIIKASLCLLVLSLSLISSKGFPIGFHFWMPNHSTTPEL